MADNPAGRVTLGLRLGLSFLAVAVAAIALLAGLVAAFATTESSTLVTRQRTDLTRAIAAVAATAWDRSHTWQGADLGPALALASQSDWETQVRDVSGSPVVTSAGFVRAGRAGWPQFGAPVVLRGKRLGTVVVRFGGAVFGASEHALRVTLIQAVAASAGFAALVALIAGLTLGRWLSRPVDRIIAVTRAMGAGERAARVDGMRAPRELRELAGALDQMADRIDQGERVRRDLVADVAHELRTPVAVLQAGHEALLDGMAEPTPEQLGSLRDEVLRLARMVDDLQTLAAADAAAMSLARQECDLAEIAGSAADSLAGRFATAGITVTRKLTEARVIADQRWLYQVVTNLLTNALKFSPPGATVTIDCGPSGGQAILRVSDTGIGIPPDELPRIFDRFWRGREAAQISGSGIGLAIAAELAQAHGGTLTAASTPGRGTRMTLALPVA